MDNEDMANTLNNMINSGKIPDNIKELLHNINNNNSNTTNSNSNTNSSTNSRNDDTKTSNSSITPEMLSNMLNMLGQNNSTNSNNSNNNSIDMEMFFKMKNIMDKINENKDDPRANFLISLKPYLKESRKSKVDQYARLFTMSKVMDLFNSTGGDTKK